MILSYCVEYVKNDGSGKVISSEIIHATNRDEVHIIISFLYPFISNSDSYRIKTGYGKSKLLEKNGKVKYLY